MTDCVAVCLTLLGQFSKPDSCQATELKSYLNISAFTRLAGPSLDTKGCKKVSQLTICRQIVQNFPSKIAVLV